MRPFKDASGAALAYVSEAQADMATKEVNPVNGRFEHLTCFVGGMLVLGG